MHPLRVMVSFWDKQNILRNPRSILQSMYISWVFRVVRLITEEQGLTEEDERNLKELMARHKDALKRLAECPHTCNMQYHGIRENNGKPYEVFVCEICQREEWREYTGTQDTIEWRE